MLLFNIILITVFLIDALIIYYLFRPSSNLKAFQGKRARSKVRARFRTVQEVKAFEEWRQYIKLALIEMEIEETLQGESKTKYLSI